VTSLRGADASSHEDHEDLATKDTKITKISTDLATKDTRITKDLAAKGHEECEWRLIRKCPARVHQGFALFSRSVIAEKSRACRRRCKPLLICVTFASFVSFASFVA